jgi:SH3-like domain-containing protein
MIFLFDDPLAFFSLSERLPAGKDTGPDSLGLERCVDRDMKSLSLVLLFLIVAPGAWAADSAAAGPPYFVSMKGEKTFMREGPGEDHRVKWIYHRKGLPVEVIASFDAWRRVRDMDGEVGWIHTVLLSRERTAVVKEGSEAEVFGRANPKSTVIAEAKPGAIGRLVHCAALTCEVKFAGAEGWVARTQLWGVHDGEQF